MCGQWVVVVFVCLLSEMIEHMHSTYMHWILPEFVFSECNGHEHTHNNIGSW